MRARKIPLRAIRGLLFCTVALAGLASILATSVMTDEFRSDRESFLLVHAHGETPQLRVRSSAGGHKWKDDARIGQVSVGRGVAAASDDNGALRIIATLAHGRLRLLWFAKGIETAQPPAKLDGPIAISVPSIAYQGNNRWIVAFANGEEKIALRRFDGARATLAGPDLAPTGPLNTHVLGRPAIAVFKKRVVLAWRRRGTRSTVLVTAAGRINNEGIEFDAPRKLDIPEFIQRAIVSDPDLGHGFEGQFILVFVRESAPDDPANEVASADPDFPPWNGVVMQSPDGNAWSEHSLISRYDLPVSGKSHIQIAGHTDNTIIIAAINETGPAVPLVARYCFEWTDIPAKMVFGDRPRALPFALVSAGMPMVPDERHYYFNCD